MQDGQTNGLLIGPDTSYLAGEIVLAAIDRSMLERGHVGLRYIDDFEFGCDTSSNAEQVLSDLVDSAGEFGLVLNPDKTRVVTEKIPHEEPWVGSLRRFKARREKVNNPYDRIAVRNDYMAYFSAAIDFARKNPHDSVARYAVARVAKFPTDHILWPNLQAFLLEMALEDAGALYRVLATLLRFERRGFGPDRPLLEAVLNKVIVRESQRRHGNEVSWALFGAGRFGVPVSRTAAQAAVNCEDPLVGVLLSDLIDRGVAETPGDLSPLERHFTEDSLKSEYWMLVYEAAAHGWPIGEGATGIVNQSESFRFLLENGISFYDPSGIADSEPEDIEGPRPKASWLRDWSP